MCSGKHQPQSTAIRQLPRPLVLLAISSMVCLLVSACAESPSTLDPRGPAAARIATLWWVMLALAVAVYVLVIALLLIGLTRGPRGLPTDKPGPPGSKRWIEAGGIAMPPVILLGLIGFTIYTESANPRLTV